MQLMAVILNLIYAVLGGFLTIGFMWLGYKIFDRLTDFDTSKELANQNRAVGLVVLGIFVGVGIAMGLVVGLGMN